jgi:hypothetical protein
VFEIEPAAFGARRLRDESRRAGFECDGFFTVVADEQRLPLGGALAARCRLARRAALHEDNLRGTSRGRRDRRLHGYGEREARDQQSQLFQPERCERTHAFTLSRRSFDATPRGSRAGTSSACPAE